MKRSIMSRLTGAGAWVFLAFLILPALIAVPVSLTPKRFLSFPKDSLSLRHFENLFTSPEWLSSFYQSAIIATSTALFATVLGTLSSIGLWRVTSKYSEAVRALLLLPLIIPQIISAMAFYRVWIPLGLLDSYVGLILAHTILATPMVLITVSASLANFDPTLEQASRNMGANGWTTMRRVILPSIKPGVLAGALFAFILSWDEIVVTLFISKFNVYTLPRRIWNGIRENTDPTVAAAAVVLIAITLVVFCVSLLLARQRSRSN